ncbi:uncharacterized protein Dmoj_GI19484 [Drosophila mojavensis]|uniref:Uncharacterized protein n=2 Tax=Drosophila mojavensis TaxID=7230 RepID=B4KU23_DROMO|nr:uncharacterized protein Dmoj_GI19484 [Drosophila mojavensis]
MPSIRRSRRRSTERKENVSAPAQAAAAAPTPAAALTVHRTHQSRQSTVTKLTPRKLKSNCSKQRHLVKSAVKTKTRVKLAPYDISLELPAPGCVNETAPSLARALHSQQSSLISSDLSSDCLPAKQEEHFHSSGISCNGETDDDVEVAMLTGCLSPQQLQRVQHRNRPNQRLPLNELLSLNVCRNRNAVWLHNTQTDQLLDCGRGNCETAAIADDMQLSDIEEQLAKFDGQQQQQQEQQHQQLAAKT